MPIEDVRPECQSLMRMMSGEPADRYVAELLLPTLQHAMDIDEPSISEVRNGLLDPYLCLKAIYGYYAFSRRGKDRHELASLSIEALESCTSPENIGQFLALADADSLWNAYVEVCGERKKKPMEQLNRGVIAGIAELAQEIHELDGSGSIAGWIVKGVRANQRIEPQFLRMVDVRGVGPKLTSLLLRDVVFLFEIEPRIDHMDRLYVQPIDKWMRLIAPYVIDEPDAADYADWVLAGKIAKHARRAGVSGIRFNMGTAYFGLRIARSTEDFVARIEAMTQGPGSSVQRDARML
ncbi:MAG: hypothetical protein M5U21_06695 [Fimbriimonadaceae bacterium]|nr:hypothetical protein [Fimbriimonadaceae bacterium]